MTFKVRPATPDDEDEIMLLLGQMHAEGGLLPLSEMRARDMFRRAFRKEGAVMGVVGAPGDIKAMIYLLISNYWYTEAFHLEELFNFVRPDVRNTPDGSKLADQMIEYAKKCAVETGLPLLIGVLTNKRMEGKVRLYRRSLGYPAGAFFMFNSKWQNEVAGNEDFWRLPFPARGTGKGRAAISGRVKETCDG